MTFKTEQKATKRMNRQLCVLLYSKYSPRSRQIMKVLERAPVDLTSALGLEFVCVDNKAIRAQIQAATTVKVSRVPTILVLYSSGAVEKYEGETAFRWTEQTISQISPTPEPPPPSEEETKEEKTEEPEPARKKKKKKKKPRTLVEDLDTDESDKSGDDGRPRAPPVAVRSGAGGYDITKGPATRSGPPERMGVVSQSSSSKSVDIMARAQALQKERESSGGKESRKH